MKRLTERVALVTGASRGLGKSIALRLAAEGAFVLVHYHRKQDKAQEVLDTLREAGGDGELVAFDLRDEEALNQALRVVLGKHPRIDILVNNAGVLADEAFLISSAANWQEVVDVNLLGAVRVCRALAGPMSAAGRGSIINVASVAGLRASPGQSSYSAAKGGLLAFTKTLARELAPRGVRVNAVVPGLLDDGMAERTSWQARDRHEESIALGRAGRADEVAAAVAFLASDEASYVVGHALVVDGGLSL